MLLNEGAGAVIPYGDRRLYGVCVAEKGTFRFTVRTERPRRPRLGARAGRQRAAQAGALPPAAGRRASRRYDLTEAPRALLAALGLGPRRTRRPRSSALREGDPRLAALVEPTLGRDVRADDHLRVGEDQRRSPPRARAAVDCRMPAGHGRRGDDGRARVEEVLGDPTATSSSSPRRSSATARRVESPLMDAIRDWVGERTRAPRSCRPCCPPSPTRAGSAPRSRTASPTASSPSAR